MSKEVHIAKNTKSFYILNINVIINTKNENACILNAQSFVLKIKTLNPPIPPSKKKYLKKKNQRKFMKDNTCTLTHISTCDAIIS